MNNTDKLSEIDARHVDIIREYADFRSKQFGESFDFILDEIIIGIFKRSAAILDNMGIHAPSLLKKFDHPNLRSESTANFARAVAEVIEEQKLIKESDHLANMCRTIYDNQLDFLKKKK